TRLIDSLSQITSIEKIYLQGHCDSIGNNKFNDALSSKRVNSVKTHFVSNGIDEQLIRIKALGKRASINKNANENERALNRRVDIELVVKAKEVSPKSDSKEVISNNPPDEVEVVINGVILNEKNKPLIAEVSLSDKYGKIIDSTVSGTDGKYKFSARLKKKEDYSLTYYNDSSFISSKIINVSTPRKPYKNLKTVLPELKDGNKYVLENFNFESDTSQLTAASLPSLEALYKLMKKNKTLVIRIEGHVNYPSYYPNPKKPKVSDRYVPPGMRIGEFSQWLSEERSKMVFNYLIEKGIKEKRMSTIGFGADKMLYPNARTESEKAQNRRVEINVISLKGKPLE
ncbi:MAG TPA: OmpA family protein, partial [Bacteroidia bacterium]|nr:OmpA family protein [Bacteroidia bacterium]